MSEQVAEWISFKRQLARSSPWLEAFLAPFGTAIHQNLDAKSPSAHERLLIEPLLKDISSALDRCLGYRKEAYDLDAAAVKAAVDYELFQDLSKVDVALELNSLGRSRLAKEHSGYGAASEAFSKAKADLSEGFNLHDKTLSEGASAGLSVADERQQLLTERWRILRAFHAEYNRRHTSPGNSHNFRERFERLQVLYADDLGEAFEKAKAVRIGVQTIFGAEIKLPDPASPGLLDDLVLWTRRCIQLLDVQTHKEVAYDLVIPLAQPWRVGERPLIEFIALWKIIKKPGAKKVIEFDLRDVFFNQTHLRVRAVGLSFGALPAAADDDRMMDRYAYWRLRATVHSPPQPDILNPGTHYNRPPTVLGNVSIFGRSVPVATESGFASYNVNPVGKWRIVLNALGVWADEREANVEGGLYERIIQDLKLHLRVVATPSPGADSVFLQ